MNSYKLIAKGKDANNNDFALTFSIFPLKRRGIKDWETFENVSKDHADFYYELEINNRSNFNIDLFKPRTETQKELKDFCKKHENTHTRFTKNQMDCLKANNINCAFYSSEAVKILKDNNLYTDHGYDYYGSQLFFKRFSMIKLEELIDKVNIEE